MEYYCSRCGAAVESDVPITGPCKECGVGTMILLEEACSELGIDIELQDILTSKKEKLEDLIQLFGEAQPILEKASMGFYNKMSDEEIVVVCRALREIELRIRGLNLGEILTSV